jgi:hypothetical protein
MSDAIFEDTREAVIIPYFESQHSITLSLSRSLVNSANHSFLSLFLVVVEYPLRISSGAIKKGLYLLHYRSSSILLLIKSTGLQSSRQHIYRVSLRLPKFFSEEWHDM